MAYCHVMSFYVIILGTAILYAHSINFGNSETYKTAGEFFRRWAYFMKVIQSRWPCGLSNACVWSRSIAGIVSWKPAEGMDVLFCILCVVQGAAVATSWSIVQRSHTGCVCVSNCVRSRDPNSKASSCSAAEEKVILVHHLLVFLCQMTTERWFFQCRIGELWNFSERFFWQTVTSNEYLKRQGYLHGNTVINT